MGALIDVNDPAELRKAGLRALNEALGYNGAVAFIGQYLGGTGDYTKEKYEQPEPSFEELAEELFRAEAEMQAARRK